MIESEKKIDLDVPVQYLTGVGPKAAGKLKRLGVESIRDLLWYFPRKYLDYSDISKIADVMDQISKIKDQNYGVEASNIRGSFGSSQNSESLRMTTAESATIKARISHIANKKTRRRGFTVTEAMVEDGSGTLKVVWFNQPYLAKMMFLGREIILHGKVAWDHFNQTYVMESPDWAEKPKIVPIYPETEGITSYYIAKIMSGITYLVSGIQEFLPEDIVSQNNLLGISQAVLTLHQPKIMADLQGARERMAFDELFLISLRGQILKQELEQEKSPIIEIDQVQERRFYASLPFELTRDQKRACEEIIHDLRAGKPMNRLLNGDVGSGKTVVAALAAYAVVKAGLKVMIMAPTEILANQHYITLSKMFSDHNIEVELITSSNKSERSKGRVGNAAIIVGTHALLHLKERIKKVGLVVVDEQHRFGVKQRAELQKLCKSDSLEADGGGVGGLVPHFLSMTATPIPRSLQLVLFGELDVSVIEEKPAGRREIKTRVVDESHRQKAYEFIRAHVKAGRQVFVVVPLIEETQNIKAKTQNETLDIFEIDRKTVAGEYEKLSKEIFPDLHIGMLHGKMKAAEKESVMKQFSNADLDILVSTSVVEVGVDIPNASVMMIEDAERFGLAQLHQFRGRVGRGEQQSFCLLFTDSESQKAKERLQGMESISDGFRLAELDLKTRGAGDIFGTVQSGFEDIKFANLGDAGLIGRASTAAKKVAVSDPNLSNHEVLKDKLGQFLSSKHME